MLKRYFTMLVSVLLSTLTFTACGDDDEGTGSSDFIEITLDGKTYTKSVWGIYAQFSIDDDLCVTYSTEDIFYDYGFEFFYGLTHYEKESKLLECAPGTYGVLKNYIEDNGENLDLTASLEYNEDDSYYEPESGTHKVTSIKKVEYNDAYAVQVEGTFSLNMVEQDTGETKNIKGKYRMTVDGY